MTTANIDGDRCLDVIVGAPYAGDDDHGEVYVFGTGGVQTVTAEEPAEGRPFRLVPGGGRPAPAGRRWRWASPTPTTG